MIIKIRLRGKDLKLRSSVREAKSLQVAGRGKRKVARRLERNVMLLLEEIPVGTPFYTVQR